MVDWFEKYEHIRCLKGLTKMHIKWNEWNRTGYGCCAVDSGKSQQVKRDLMSRLNKSGLRFKWPGRSHNYFWHIYSLLSGVW